MIQYINYKSRLLRCLQISKRKSVKLNSAIEEFIIFFKRKEYKYFNTDGLKMKPFYHFLSA